MLLVTIEKSLLLLWRHIDFYLAYYEPSTSTKGYNNVFSNITDGQTKNLGNLFLFFC